MSEALSRRAQGDVVVLGWRVWWFVGLWFPWRVRIRCQLSLVLESPGAWN